MRSALVFLLLVTSMGCRNKDATPSGTQLVSWDRSQSSRKSMPGAKVLGTPTSKDVMLHAEPSIGGKAMFALHLETVDVELVEDGTTYVRSAPVVVRIKVADSGGYATTAKCDGPNYYMPSASADGGLETPKPMLLDCSINMVKGGSNAIVSMQINGEGKIEPALMGGKVELK